MIDVEALTLPRGRCPVQQFLDALDKKAVSNMKTIPADSLFKKFHKDKGYRKLYEKIAPLMGIAVAIAGAREKVGLTQTQLASRLGTTQSVISRIEQGNQNLSIQMLSRIAAILHCHLEVGLRPIHRKAA